MELTHIFRQLEAKPEDRWLLLVLAGGVLLLIVSYILFLPYLALLAPSGYSIIDQQTVFTYQANQTIRAAWKAIDGGSHASLR